MSNQTALVLSAAIGFLLGMTIALIIAIPQLLKLRRLLLEARRLRNLAERLAWQNARGVWKGKLDGSSDEVIRRGRDPS